jgi:hypothetical protein
MLINAELRLLNLYILRAILRYHEKHSSKAQDALLTVVVFGDTLGVRGLGAFSSLPTS